MVVVAVVFLNKILNGWLQDSIYRLAKAPGISYAAKLANLSKYTNAFLNTKRLINENAKLKQQNIEFLSAKAEADSLKLENNLLRAQLRVAERTDNQLLMAHAYNIQRGQLVSTLLIDKGKLDGIMAGMPVIASGNVLVGAVSQALDHTSLVVIVDDPRSKLSVRVLSGATAAQTRGLTHNQLKVDLVTKQDQIKEGDALITNGLDGLPPSLLVALVTGVSSTSADLFQYVTAKPLYDPVQNPTLFVITESKK